MEVNFDTYPGEFTCNISWGECMSVPSELSPYGYYAEPSSFFNSYLPNFDKAYNMWLDPDQNSTIWMNGFQYLHMHGVNLNCKYLCFPTTVNHISIANSAKFNGYVNFQRTEWYNVNYNNYTDKKSPTRFDMKLIVRGVTDFSNAFRNCLRFNKPIPDYDNCYYARDCTNMFAGSPNFNLPFNVTNNVELACNMFRSCSRLNSYINIQSYFNGPDDQSPRLNCYGMFSDCYNIVPSCFADEDNDHIIPGRIVDSSYMFANCPKMTYIPDTEYGYKTYETANYMFYNCKNLRNPDINFPDNTIANAEGMFKNCVHLNSYRNVELRSGLINTQYMFANCYIFNTIVNFGMNIDNAYHMFENCWEFNQPIDFNNHLTYLNNAKGMFYNCIALNQPIEIDIPVNDGNGMFEACRGLTQNINITNNFNIATRLFIGVNIEIDSINFVDTYCVSTSSMFASLNLNVTNLNIRNCYNMAGMFGNVGNIRIDSFNVSGYTEKLGTIFYRPVIRPNNSSLIQINNFNISLSDGPETGGNMFGSNYGWSSADLMHFGNLYIQGNNFDDAFSNRPYMSIDSMHISVDSAVNMFNYSHNLADVIVEAFNAKQMFYGSNNISGTVRIAQNANQIFWGANNCNIKFECSGDCYGAFGGSNNCIVALDDSYRESMAGMFQYSKNLTLTYSGSNLIVNTPNAWGLFAHSYFSGNIKVVRSDTAIGSIADTQDTFVNLYTYSSNFTRGLINKGSIFVPNEELCYAIKSKQPFYPSALHNGSGYWIIKDSEEHEIYNEYRDNWPISGATPNGQGSIVFDNKLYYGDRGKVQVATF